MEDMGWLTFTHRGSEGELVELFDAEMEGAGVFATLRVEYPPPGAGPGDDVLYAVSNFVDEYHIANCQIVVQNGWGEQRYSGDITPDLEYYIGPDFDEPQLSDFSPAGRERLEVLYREAQVFDELFWASVQGLKEGDRVDNAIFDELHAKYLPARRVLWDVQYMAFVEQARLEGLDVWNWTNPAYLDVGCV